MNKILFLLVLTAVVAVVACAMNGSKVNDDLFSSVGNDDFEQVIADTAHVTLLDVRTSEEYADGHIPGAMLIDVKKDDFMAKARMLLPQNKTIAVYCRSGRRSVTAAEKLVADGFKVINLKGGITAWAAAGKPIEK